MSSTAWTRPFVAAQRLVPISAAGEKDAAKILRRAPPDDAAWGAEPAEPPSPLSSVFEPPQPRAAEGPAARDTTRPAAVRRPRPPTLRWRPGVRATAIPDQIRHPARRADDTVAEHAAGPDS
jgi:hypothetical protein